MILTSNNKEIETHKEESKDKPIYVKVSEETRNLIDKYKNKGTTISDLVKNSIRSYDAFLSMSPVIHGIIDKYKEKKESTTSFIERAIKYYGDQKDLNRDLWVRAREEMKMMLIGKTTFNQLIAAAEAPEERLDKPFKKNVAIDLILWYNDSRPLKSLTMDEIIGTIQKIWVVSNYFYKIDVVKENKKSIYLLFKHRQNKRYSSYWFGYFKELFTSEEMPFKASIEGQAFEESLSITLTLE
ncbi:hypothetical protein LCGC14_1553910 [marine sediment metagenome]|uniref:Cyclic nucleotide-binding domain-containing protein n=1 Tax=marine sediment metagenome TaxID=412755 RepID=A0A0F9L5Q0_9ZZZZ